MEHRSQGQPVIRAVDGACVRPLAKDEIPAAAEMLALAFDPDPLFRWFVPSSPHRARWLRWLLHRALGEAHAVGGAYTLEGGNGPDRGALGIYPPGTWPPNIGAVMRATPAPPELPPYRLVVGGLTIERAMHRRHPAEPHLYVYVLGVHPSQKGHGLGGTLLRHAAEIAKEAGVVSHLETSNPDNLPLYGRFGFEVKSEIVAHGGPPVWTMTTAR